ncbi:hypothetical protein EVA_15307 [gut metagenome]|uniref:Uncharacterized protein n=1 Tax=gut metagenome TaxID=749906 RepID=J9G460_9ZZZZ
MSYNDSNLIQVLEILVQVVGETLGSSTNSIDVHAVGTRTHDTAQATGTEFEGTVEAFDEFSLVFFGQHFLYCILCCLVIEV